MKPLRFFYIPNEMADGDQIGPRKAFTILHQKGIFSAYSTYSFLVARKKFKTHGDALRDLFEETVAFRPDVIYWQHLNDSYPVDRYLLQGLKNSASRPKLVWHDPDPYGRLIKPIDSTMKTALAECDMAILVGLGYLADDVRKAGATRILFAPHSYDDARFDQPWQPTLKRTFDVIMIANLTCLKRIPWLYLPGGRNRKIMSQAFYRAYGNRYAVFGAGQGWSGEVYCRGPIAFNAQEETIRSAWLTVNWGQFDQIAMYSSDRLPISLAAGVPHITNYQRGYEHVFPDAKGIYFVRSPAEALDVADMLLSQPRQKLIEIGLEGTSYVRARLNAVRVYSDIVTAISQQLFDDI